MLLKKRRANFDFGSLIKIIFSDIPAFNFLFGWLVG
jgi:hypothetical protein